MNGFELMGGNVRFVHGIVVVVRIQNSFLSVVA